MSQAAAPGPRLNWLPVATRRLLLSRVSSQTARWHLMLLISWALLFERPESISTPSSHQARTPAIDSPLGGLILVSLLQVRQHIPNFVESGTEVFGDFGSQDVRIRQAGRIFEALVAEPENIEAGLVASDE